MTTSWRSGGRFLVPLFVLLILSAGALPALAQAGADRSQAFLQQTQATAKNAWGLLSTIGSVVVGGGALISLAMGMYRGQWGQAAISFVAGAAGLLSIWGVGQALGY
jgi:hypothetical protein